MGWDTLRLAVQLVGLPLVAICGYADAAFEVDRMDDACHTASNVQGVREARGGGECWESVRSACTSLVCN